MPKVAHSSWLMPLVVCGAGVLAALGWRALPSPPPLEPGLPAHDPVGAGGVKPAQDVRFGRDIRPILSDRCFKCHGPDPKTRAENLRLDTFEDATAPRKDSKPAVSPGKSSDSELWRRISSSDPKVVMPPPESGKKPLTDHEKALLKTWIDRGAAYEPHWAFVPPARPPEPAVKAAAWPRNPVDRFILARLEREGLAPSPEADRATLARRVFLDLTGLPPTPEELDAFLADPAPDAYEKLVDRLLTAEPYVSRYAERMTAPWLDQARYADTCGIHMDAGRQMWLWRDWVLAAYRDNLPFDRFVREQLAGDLIPDASDAQKIASGFNRNHVTTDEGGAIADEYLVEYAVDRTATTGSVFLGLTVGCARCHDHKFDPITAEDFYSLYAFFNSIEEPGLYSQEPDPTRAFEPFLTVLTPEHKAAVAAIASKADALRAALDVRKPEDEARREAFLASVRKTAALAWAQAKVSAASADQGVVLTPADDRSVTASGPNPKTVTYELTLRTDAPRLRALSLEALKGPDGRVGRSDNGNVVVSAVKAEAVSVKDPARRQTVSFNWVWATLSQKDGDYDAANLIDAGRPPSAGWALAQHQGVGERTALLLADKPFGFEGGTELHVRIEQTSHYDFHTLQRLRVDVGDLDEAALALLPSVSSLWYAAGPFPGDKDNRVYEPTFGPEDGLDDGTRLDFAARWGEKKNLMWRYDGRLSETGRPVDFPAGRNVVFIAKYVYAPTARTIDVSLGSDDAWKLYVNGKEVAGKFVERGVMPDQDKAVLELKPGRNVVLMKIVNTGGPGGASWKQTERPASDTALSGDLVAALLPRTSLPAEWADRVDRAWRSTFLPEYRDTAAKLAALEAEKAKAEASAPRTMVMKELAKPRETFVLTRGQYDHPDKERPVQRRVPSFFGTLPEGAPADRLGLAAWITAPGNPLLARVSVNRLWETAFGNGLVRTTEDFGYQGDWPSHPELLDWLAVEFRESGWDVKRTLKLLVTSAAYRQSSVVRRELLEQDPENRLLSYFPRRRLTAEQIRDGALYIAGLLTEKLGGPSVKPYQPEGLWTEVAMPQSNTRLFERGMGPDLYRRSIYTYWKRAAPPPSMLTFDAPTREACTIRRPSTNTPLQALVLWNDEQFVEAARALAQRTLAAPGDDAQRLASILRRCTGHAPDAREAAALARALADFRARFKDKPADAEGLLKLGLAERPKDLPADELAAWTMIASSIMNLHAAVTQD